jgi:hypothetical protein
VNVQVTRINRKDDSNESRDFSLDDVKLRIAAPLVSLNGTLLPMTSKNKDDVSGPRVWFYLPDRGRYVLSLLSRSKVGVAKFVKAGEVDGNTLMFTIDGDAFELRCSNEIVPGDISYNLYVLHEPAWRPQVAGDRNSFILGSGYYGDPPEVIQVSNTGEKYYISGEVRKAGAYPLTSSKTVYEALMQAGGLGDFAKSTKIYLLRDKQKIPFNYKEVSEGKNLQQNITLQNGDVIVVP